MEFSKVVWNICSVIIFHSLKRPNMDFNFFKKKPTPPKTDSDSGGFHFRIEGNKNTGDLSVKINGEIGMIVKGFSVAMLDKDVYDMVKTSLLFFELEVMGNAPEFNKPETEAK